MTRSIGEGNMSKIRLAHWAAVFLTCAFIYATVIVICAFDPACSAIHMIPIG